MKYILFYSMLLLYLLIMGLVGTDDLKTEKEIQRNVYGQDTSR